MGGCGGSETSLPGSRSFLRSCCSRPPLGALPRERAHRTRPFPAPSSPLWLHQLYRGAAQPAEPPKSPAPPSLRLLQLGRAQRPSPRQLRRVMPNTAMKKKVRSVRYIKNMKVKVRNYCLGNICVYLWLHLPSFLDCCRSLLCVLPDSCPLLCYWI